MKPRCLRSCAAGRNGAGARRGYSLLELTLAIALTAGTLTPALALLRDGMDLGRSTDEQLLLTNYATRLLEERLAVVGSGWITTTEAGDLAADGFSSLRYIVTTTDDPASGGLADALMHITVTTYIDDNSNAALDQGELNCVFSTKVANFASYVHAATN